MPIYEYICQDCRHRFDQLVTSRRTKVRCGKCNSRRISRQISTFAAHGGSDSSVLPCGQSNPGSCPAGGTACSSGSCPLH